MSHQDDAVAAVAALAAVMLADEKDGTAPKNATRLVSADERRAKVRFGEIEEHLDAAAARVTETVEDLQIALSVVLASALFGDAGQMNAVALLARFNTAAAVLPEGMARPLRDAAEGLAGVAADVEAVAVEDVQGEAKRQGVDPAADLPEAPSAVLWLSAASAVALAAWERVVTLVRRDLLTPQAVAEVATFTRSQFATTVTEFDLAGPVDLGRQLTLQANRAGRDRAATTYPVATIFASEIMDGNTCGPCARIDGREFDTFEEARAQYPFGGYQRCEGGLRCRGTLVYVLDEDGELPPPPADWKSDAFATLDELIPPK